MGTFSQTVTVTEIEETKNHVVIYTDHSEFLKLHKKYFELLPLSVGDEIDREEYADRLSAIQAKPAYEAALDLLSARDMTSYNLYQALMRRGFVAPVAEATCQRLTENGLLDDERYAQRFVELRQNSPVGRYAMRQKLRAKGIDADTAEEALEQLDDENQLSSAKALAQKFVRRYENEEPYKKKSKLSQALARRGFSWEIVREAVESVLEDDAVDTDW